MINSVTVRRLLMIAVAACAAVVAVVLLTGSTTATTGDGHRATVGAAPIGRQFMYDGHDLHWNVGAWAGDCGTLRFDVYYSDGQSPNWMTFDPCDTAHALPDQPTAGGCVTETWWVYASDVVERHPAAPLAGGRFTYCPARPSA